jgi:hypothetical protein
MKMVRRVLVISFVVAIGSHASAAFAQLAGPSNLQYTPQPTVSPYLNLFNNPNGIATYQTLVRPFLQQNDYNSQQNYINNQVQQELNQVRETSGLGATGASRGIRPTGTGQAATYMNLSHYYSGGRAK